MTQIHACIIKPVSQCRQAVSGLGQMTEQLAATFNSLGYLASGDSDRPIAAKSCK